MKNRANYVSRHHQTHQTNEDKKKTEERDRQQYTPTEAKGRQKDSVDSNRQREQERQMDKDRQLRRQETVQNQYEKIYITNKEQTDRRTDRQSTEP